jgi:acyl-CoA synthetase (AMP-forming)/AMP-acid ligase II/acyl carrier protein
MCYFFMLERNPHIIDHLLEYALTIPDSTAFIILEDGESIVQRITYKELAAKVTELASSLVTQDLRSKRVLLVYQDIMEFIVCFLAVQYSGIIPVPVPYAKGSKQIERLTGIIKDAGAAAILCNSDSVIPIQKGLGVLLEAGNVQIIPTDVPYTTGGGSINLKPLYNDTAFIQYTSGSTSKPKGVVITATNLMHNQLLLKKTFGCNKHSVIFSWLPFHHDMGLIGNILHALYIGCTCVIMSPFHFIQKPQRWLKAISNYKITHSGGPNFAYDLCVNKISPDELAELNLTSWKVAYNGSEPVRFETMQRFAGYFKQRGFDIQSFSPCYGLAEATLLVSGNKLNEAPAALMVDKHSGYGSRILLKEKPDSNTRLLVSSGSVAPGMEVIIISPQVGLQSKELEGGEICISGESVSKGYWNKDNGDFFYVFDGKRYLRTGDLGFVYQNKLFVLGRLKEMLIIRGRNFYPYDVEQIVWECHPAVEPNGVAVFSLTDSEEEFVIAAEIKRALLKTIDAETIIHAIETAVVGSLGIRAFDIILIVPSGIPRTTSGKLQRMKCKDLYAQEAFQLIESKSNLSKKPLEQTANSLLLQKVLHYGDPDSIKSYLMHQIESKIGRMSADILSLETALTDIGIDSIRAMELVNTINKELHLHIDASKIFQDNRLLTLITVIENMLWLKSKQPCGKELTI